MRGSKPRLRVPLPHEKKRVFSRRIGRGKYSLFTFLRRYKGRKGLLRATEVDLTQSGLMRSLRKSAENQCAKAGNRQEFALCETIVRGKETAGVSTSGRCVQRCTRRRRVSGLRHKTSRRRCLARTEPAPCKPDARVRPAAEQTTSTSTRSQPAASRGA